MFCGYYNYSWLMLLSKLNEKVSYNLINNNPNNYNENLLNDNNNSNEIKIELDDTKEIVIIFVKFVMKKYTL